MILNKKAYMFSLEYGYREVKVYSFDQHSIIIENGEDDVSAMVEYGYTEYVCGVYELSLWSMDDNYFPDYAVISDNKDSLYEYLNNLINNQILE